MNRNPDISAADHAKLVGLLDDGLTREEFDELNAAMKQNPALRQAWIHLRDLDTELLQRFRQPNDVGHESRGSITAKAWWPVAAIIALAAVVLLAFAFPWTTDDSRYVAADVDGLESVAVVTSIESVEWADEADLQVGASLKPGVVRLRQGKLGIDFLSGASVSLEGPAEFRLVSDRQAFLLSGKAAAKVPPEAIGFLIKSPDAAVADLGTEFAMEVSDDGESLVHVYDGEVRVSLLGRDGATSQSSPMHTGDSLRVIPEEQKIVSTAEGISGLPRVANLDETVLSVPAEYQHQVMAGQPLIYWSFDAVENRSVANRVGSEFRGKLTGESLAVSNSVLAFSEPNGESRFLSTAAPFPSLQEFTFSFWVKPLKSAHATLVAVCSDKVNETSKIPHHQNVIELMHRTHLIHPPHSIRFLHRTPKGERNAFSVSPFLTGQWHHVVAVIQKDRMRLFVNQHLVRELDVVPTDPPQAMRLVLGQLDHVRPERQFCGFVDEFALFDRELEPKEIRQQFQTIAQANPSQF